MQSTTLIVKKTVRGEVIEHDYICGTEKANKLVKQFPKNYRLKETISTAKKSNAKDENKEGKQS